MVTRIYVGGLTNEATKNDLQELFAAFKSLTKVSIVTDRETQASRGFAFIEVEDGDEATKLIETFNGQEFMGKRLDVNVARPRAERPAFGTHGGGAPRSGGNDFAPRKRY